MSNIEVIYPDPGRRLWNEELTQFVLGKSITFEMYALSVSKDFLYPKNKNTHQNLVCSKKEHNTTTADVKG